MKFKKGNIPWNKGKKTWKDKEHPSYKHIPKKVLYQKYVVEGKTTTEIAKELAIGLTTVNRKLKKYNISLKKGGFKEGNMSWNKGKKYKNIKCSLKLRELCRKGIFIVWNKGITSKDDNRILSGKRHPHWKGGISFEPYTPDFSIQLKEAIRKRDGYRCQECFRHQDELYFKNGKKYKLNIHHIDFNKKNSNPNNLISLCRSCHLQTNYNREQWTEYFQNKIIGVNI